MKNKTPNQNSFIYHEKRSALSLASDFSQVLVLFKSQRQTIYNFFATSNVCYNDRAMLSDLHQVIQYLIYNWRHLMSNCFKQCVCFDMIVYQDC